MLAALLSFFAEVSTDRVNDGAWRIGHALGTLLALGIMYFLFNKITNRARKE
jgi:hypothetical protein